VLLEPVDPGDHVFESAFNDQRRTAAGERRPLGVDATTTVTDLFRAAGWSVRVEDTSVRLDGGDPEIAREWLEDWVGAAVAGRPALEEWGDEYLRTRFRQLAAGTLRVDVQHQEIGAWSP